MRKILIVVGTRPNFIKVTQFKKVAEKYKNIEIKILHTGQHFDQNMAQIFFEQFNLEIDYFLDINTLTPTSQIAEIMKGLEDYILKEFQPDLIITPGDVNSTLAVAITANKMGVKLAHLESGLRSKDRKMPEEINRLLTDEITDFYFVTEKSGIENLESEKRTGEIHFVGNTMIDTLVAFQEEINASKIKEELNIKGEFVLITLHRPSNVDNKEQLLKLLTLIEELSDKYQIVFPIHPRTIKRMEEFDIYNVFTKNPNVIVTSAMGYFEFQHLVKNTKLVITDSGGIQEETSFAGIPCLTLRENTERPITIEKGTNTLIPFDLELIRSYIKQIEFGTYKEKTALDKWDGKATERILAICNELKV